MAPVLGALIGSAFWAGLLATAGLSLSEALLARLDTRESSAASGALEKTRPPL
jgi:hypothetical protein